MAKSKNSKAVGQAPELTDFTAWGQRLRSALRKATQKKKRKKKSSVRPRKRAAETFKLAAYRYLRDLKQAMLIGKLRDEVEKRDGSQWKGHGDSDELWVLRLATEGEQTDQKRATRTRWAPELRLADLNDVEPDLLLGFLYEAGPGTLIKKGVKKGLRYGWAEPYRVKSPPKDAKLRPKSKRGHE